MSRWGTSTRAGRAARHQLDRAAAQRLELIEQVSAHIVAVGLGPPEVRVRVVDKRELVLDTRGVVHAVIGTVREHGILRYEARDLRGYRWAGARDPLLR